MRAGSSLARRTTPEDFKGILISPRKEPKLHLFLYWVGEIYPQSPGTQTRTISMPPDKVRLTIGRRSTETTQFQFDEETTLIRNQLSTIPEIDLFSQIPELPPVGIHAVITRSSNDTFVISANAPSKIFVNNKRIEGDVQLKEMDVISFGWPYSQPVRSGEIVDYFKYDLKFKVHICDGEATANRHYLPVHQDYHQERYFLPGATRHYTRKFTWINREIASILYSNQTDPICIQLLRLMEEHRLRRDFALNIDHTKDKYIQFLILHNYTSDTDEKVVNIRTSFSRFIIHMMNNAPDFTVEYKYMSTTAFIDEPQSLDDIPFGSTEPDHKNKNPRNQVFQIVLLFIDRSDPFESWFNNIINSLSHDQGLIIGVYHEDEQDSFEVINDFICLLGGYDFSLLPKLECPWRIWGVKRLVDQSFDLQELHAWFCEVYRGY